MCANRDVVMENVVVGDGARGWEGSVGGWVGVRMDGWSSVSADPKRDWPCRGWRRARNKSRYAVSLAPALPVLECPHTRSHAARPLSGKGSA